MQLTYARISHDPRMSHKSVADLVVENKMDTILEQLSLSEQVSPTLFIASVAAITNTFSEVQVNNTRFVDAVVSASTLIQRELLGFLSQSNMTSSLYPFSTSSQFFANNSWTSMPVNANVAAMEGIIDPTSGRYLQKLGVSTILGGSSHQRLLVATTTLGLHYLIAKTDVGYSVMSSVLAMATQEHLNCL